MKQKTVHRCNKSTVRWLSKGKYGWWKYHRNSKYPMKSGLLGCCLCICGIIPNRSCDIEWKHHKPLWACVQSVFTNIFLIDSLVLCAIEDDSENGTISHPVKSLCHSLPVKISPHAALFSTQTADSSSLISYWWRHDRGGDWIMLWESHCSQVQRLSILQGLLVSTWEKYSPNGE